jgi:hypothetical protein
MPYISVKNLRIFDVAHYEDRGRKKGTLLSMDIDGVKVYSIPLTRVVNPASCENAVAMFKTEDRQSLCAWLDPASKNASSFRKQAPAKLSSSVSWQPS